MVEKCITDLIHDSLKNVKKQAQNSPRTVVYIYVRAPIE